MAQAVDGVMEMVIQRWQGAWNCVVGGVLCEQGGVM